MTDYIYIWCSDEEWILKYNNEFLTVLEKVLRIGLRFNLYLQTLLSFGLGPKDCTQAL